VFDLTAYLEQKQALVGQSLERHLPAATERPARLHEAMRYSVLAGGKRLRPILCLAACEAVGGAEDDALLPALAVEALHTYTLIHDDLPAMDDDALRRGKPTCHVVYGEAAAILAGDALLTLAFEWLARCRAPKPYLPNQLALELAEAAGSRGVIGGQIEDLAAEGRPPDAALLEYIHLHKTAALIRAAVRMGAIAGGAEQAELDALTIYGCDAGLAFQITDDLLNATSSTEELGKAAGSDARRRKLTYVAVHGSPAARERAEQLVNRATGELARLRGNAEPLRALARHIAARTR
jgi:geranylgeranyl diphosphate synthase type II